MLSHFLIVEHNFLGILGVVFVLFAYFLIQLGKLSSRAFLYSMMNFIGSILILISLYFTPNIPSVVIEVAWLLISAMGLVRYALRKK